MSRFLIGVVLATLVCAAGVLAAEDREKPRSERTVTGVIEKVDAQSEKAGTVVLRTAGDEPVRLTLEINSKTKVLRPTADPLEQGLKNPRLKRSRAKVVYVDLQRKGESGKARIVHLCRTLQIIKPDK